VCAGELNGLDVSRNRRANREKRLASLSLNSNPATDKPSNSPSHPYSTEKSKASPRSDPDGIDFNQPQDPLSPAPQKGAGDLRDIQDSGYSDTDNDQAFGDPTARWGKDGTEPRKGHYRQLLLQGFSNWCNVNQALSALTELEQGQFRRAALFADAMMRDERIAACWTTLINGLLALPKKFEPEEGKEDDPAAQRAAEIFGKQFPKMFPQEELARNTFFGVFLGLGLGEKIWYQIDGPAPWSFRLKAWHPQFVYWNPGTHRYQLSTDPTGAAAQLASDTSLIEISESGDDHWAVFHPYGGSEGWFQSLIRSLAIPYMFRQFGIRDWARFSEVYGTPTRAAYVPEWADAAQRETFITQLQNLGNEPVLELLVREGVEKGFDFKIVQAMASDGGVGGFNKMLEYVDGSIAIVLLGQNLTTQSGRVGSNALGKIHQNVKEDYIKRWAQAIEEYVHNEFAVPWAIYNFGDASLAPYLRINADPPEDLKSKSEVIVNISQALVNLTQVQGADVDANAVLDEFNIPRIGADDDKVDETPQPVTPRPAAAPPKDPNAPKLPKDPDEGGPSVPVASDTPGDTSPPDADNKLTTSLAVRALERKPLSRGQRWIDGLAEKGNRQMAQLTAGDLRELKHAIDASTSFEDMRSRVLKTYRDLPAPQVQALLEVALSLAGLAGTAAASE
jgi:phage gp29-like protein